MIVIDLISTFDCGFNSVFRKLFCLATPLTLERTFVTPSTTENDKSALLSIQDISRHPLCGTLV